MISGLEDAERIGPGVFVVVLTLVSRLELGDGNPNDYGDQYPDGFDETQGHAAGVCQRSFPLRSRAVGEDGGDGGAGWWDADPNTDAAGDNNGKQHQLHSEPRGGDGSIAHQRPNGNHCQNAGDNHPHADIDDSEALPEFDMGLSPGFPQVGMIDPELMPQSG